MLIAEIFEAIQKQTGNSIKFGQGGPEPPPVRIDVDYKDAPFWPTFDKILDQTGLTVDSYGVERTLSLNVARAEMLPRTQTASYNGPFPVPGCPRGREPRPAHKRRPLHFAHHGDCVGNPASDPSACSNE